MSRIIKINKNSPEVSKIKQAAEVIRRGGLVAFPTETVYGLGADALNKKAVKKIFEVKGRPPDDPIIVHIADRKELKTLAEEIPEEAEKLIDRFWPGPLTLVFKKTERVPKVTTGGLETVAVRMPDNAVALSLIREAGTPVAAPSANLFGKPSPTSAKHVQHDLKGKIDLIIDGGSTRIGVESTVLDVTSSPPVLLRPGGVTLEELKEVVGEVLLHPAVKGKVSRVAKAPGMKYRHYAPEAKVILVEGKPERVRRRIKLLLKKFKSAGVITTDEKHSYRGEVVFIGRKPKEIARKLFKVFREFDERGVDVIIAESISETGLGLAVMNRMKKAAYKIIRV
ncbi:MAG: L-threonylcarbamoyladenylate synthase [Candidatus Micrarchaeia archaeon]